MIIGIEHFTVIARRGRLTGLWTVFVSVVGATIICGVIGAHGAVVAHPAVRDTTAVIGAVGVAPPAGVFGGVATTRVAAIDLCRSKTNA